jgi:acyl-[acyl-carrier-protein]-phospholipid O-acyltransferase/long-chain-fatty-acid--[acyl-carrier-protein] ligase
VEQRAARRTCLARCFIRTCKQRKRGLKIADSTGNELSGGAVLMRTMILRRLLVRHVLAPDEQYVGLLLPPSVGAVLANMAVTLDRRVPVNLNYSVTPDIINECIRQAGIRHVLTSRRFMEKMKLDLQAELVFLEDLPNRLTWRDKVVGLAGRYLLPSRCLEWWFGLQDVQDDDLATVVFTSGSTGQPKGVMLTQANVASNIDAIEQVVRLTHTDVLVGILPFFHSFGYTVTLWTVMAIDVQGVFHFSPLDGKQIGKLCKKHGGTVLLATPTFLRTYLRRCERDDFTSLDVVVAGAEKLPLDLADAFEKKYGIRPIEGYGTTELSPLVSVNVPPSRSCGGGQVELKEGSVGRPVPGVSAKITDLDTGAELPVGQQGMLWVRGPNVMKGYLNRPDLTAEVVKDGWFMTGDVAIIDQDGFIHITGRESRFSKIGGEMVPHIRVEEAIARLLGAGEEDGPQIAVTAVPDATRGERLVVLHTRIGKTPDELRDQLKDDGLPCLYIPSTDSFREVAHIPVLGSGKLDLRAVKKLALEAFPPS